MSEKTHQKTHNPKEENLLDWTLCNCNFFLQCKMMIWTQFLMLAMSFVNFLTAMRNQFLAPWSRNSFRFLLRKYKPCDPLQLCKAVFAITMSIGHIRDSHFVKALPADFLYGRFSKIHISIVMVLEVFQTAPSVNIHRSGCVLMTMSFFIAARSMIFAAHRFSCMIFFHTLVFPEIDTTRMRLGNDIQLCNCV